MQLAALLARQSGSGNTGFDPSNLLLIPASLLGTSIGLALFGRMTDFQFSRAVNILLIVSGLSYVL